MTVTSERDKKSAKLQSEWEVVAGLLHKCVEENAHSALDQIEYQQRYSSLVERYENAKNELRNTTPAGLAKLADLAGVIYFIEGCYFGGKVSYDHSFFNG